ncbi:endocuticle structural glycoprotein SgAbd-5-like [Lutzomyia longipalpis]|uniref:Putative endocuticle structural glycoprotein sgabd-5 n=1 Tax=Lutzomyia longipalpis TaxID=7200 RepID=A0A1B0CR52_LUTLO|nr:endocuticle structural glycoprotein SgAbd-5-like [Lutzomyia longipalpis]
MKTIVFALSCIVACCLAAPQGPNPQDVQLVRYVNNQDQDQQGGYQFTYELSDGQIRSETGALKDVGEERVIIVQGAYTFVGPDGQIYWVNYTADENGFHPVIGTGPEGGIKPGQDQGIDPNALKSLVG